jgi:hypothetical protein
LETIADGASRSATDVTSNRRGSANKPSLINR